MTKLLTAGKSRQVLSKVKGTQYASVVSLTMFSNKLGRGRGDVHVKGHVETSRKVSFLRKPEDGRPKLHKFLLLPRAPTA